MARRCWPGVSSSARKARPSDRGRAERVEEVGRDVEAGDLLRLSRSPDRLASHHSAADRCVSERGFARASRGSRPAPPTRDRNGSLRVARRDDDERDRRRRSDTGAAPARRAGRTLVLLAASASARVTTMTALVAGRRHRRARLSHVAREAVCQIRASSHLRGGRRHEPARQSRRAQACRDGAPADGQRLPPVPAARGTRSILLPELAELLSQVAENAVAPLAVGHDQREQPFSEDGGRRQGSHGFSSTVSSPRVRLASAVCVDLSACRPAGVTVKYRRGRPPRSVGGIVHTRVEAAFALRAARGPCRVRRAPPAGRSVPRAHAGWARHRRPRPGGPRAGRRIRTRRDRWCGFMSTMQALYDYVAGISQVPVSPRSTVRSSRFPISGPSWDLSDTLWTVDCGLEASSAR